MARARAGPSAALPHAALPHIERGRLAIAASILVSTTALVVTLRGTTGAEIDLRRLGTANDGIEVPDGTARATLVMEDNGSEGARVFNRGEVAAEKVEVLAPEYRLIGRLAPDEGFAAPAASSFRVRYEWPNRWGVQNETKTFIREAPAPTTGTTRRPAADRPTTDATDEARTVVALPGAPEGLVATYDAATHILTVRAHKAVNVRADGYLLRPTRRTDSKLGTEYRYLPAKVLVLGQNLRRGEEVAFEVVFTRPQEAYSIPLYVWEDGGEPVYIEVGVAASGGGAG